MANDRPVRIELEPGIHGWCTCGRCESAPLSSGCDDAHPPFVFRIETRRQVRLCRCRRTSCPPFCDGSHFRAPADERF